MMESWLEPENPWLIALIGGALGLGVFGIGFAISVGATAGGHGNLSVLVWFFPLLSLLQNSSLLLSAVEWAVVGASTGYLLAESCHRVPAWAPIAAHVFLIVLTTLLNGSH